jgi:hypothetical protein
MHRRPTFTAVRTLAAAAIGCWLAVSGLARAAHGQTYDASANYSASLNPNGVWTYGYETAAGTALIPYVHEGNNINGNVNIDDWYGDLSPSFGDPVLAHNNSSATQYESTLALPPGVVLLHPGPQGQPSVLRWTAPLAGTVSLSGMFEGLDTHGTTSDITIVHNSNLSSPVLADTQVTGFMESSSFASTVTVAAGDTIDFLVSYGSNNDYNYDSTGLAASISYTTGTGGGCFDAVADFSALHNPNGSWSYGYKTAAAPTTFVPYNTESQPFGSAFDSWYDPTVGSIPTVVHNNTGTTQSFSTFVIPPDLLNIHPGVSLQRSVIRWTAPLNGTVQVNGWFQGLDVDGTTTDVQVTYNNTTTVFSGEVTGYGPSTAISFPFTMSVSAGDTIDFSVGDGTDGGYFFDSTGIAATICYQ